MTRLRGPAARILPFALITLGLMAAGTAATATDHGVHLALAAALITGAFTVSRKSTRTRAEPQFEGPYVQFLETMAQALDARDPYTAGHSFRVAAYSDAIAREMGLTEKQCEMIRIAGQLHDIGKIGIPDAILQKAGHLTSAEYGLIKIHPQVGRKILEKMSRFEEILPVVELHHENFDGSGYPYKLSGERIPLAARIVRVADAFDSMTSSRSYREAMPTDKAIDEIVRYSGTHFDPKVAQAFLNLIARGKPETLLEEHNPFLMGRPEHAPLSRDF